MDLVVKARYFSGLMTGSDRARPLYEWHIEHRTGGREPGSWKRTITDYLTAADELLAEMMRNGFGQAHPVKLNRQSELIAGAHRVACAQVLGLQVFVEVWDKRGPQPWGAAWFLAHGCDTATVAELVRESEAIRG